MAFQFGINLLNSFNADPSQDLDLQHHVLWFFLAFNGLNWEVIVPFVDIIGTFDHLCLIFRFVICKDFDHHYNTDILLKTSREHGISIWY
jgi:hypothetical protein